MTTSYCTLALALALLTSCGTNTTPATTAATPAATKPAATPTSGSGKAVENPGEACTIQVAGITFTRSLNGAAQNAQVDKGKLTLRSAAKRDYFNDPDGKLTNNTAPVLLTKVDNSQPFTLVAKVTPSFLEMYDAGVLYLFVRNDWWQKFCFERDERARTRVVSVRTIGTSDDNDHDLITRKAVYMKISSDTKTVGFYHSLDGTTWELARLYKNDYPADIWLGLSTQSPIGKGTSAQFEECSLTKTSIKDFRLGI
jgi:regulation of enolase protein 1 (concanavalin A-like superfamily)